MFYIGSFLLTLNCDFTEKSKHSQEFTQMKEKQHMKELSVPHVYISSIHNS